MLNRSKHKIATLGVVFALVVGGRVNANDVPASLMVKIIMAAVAFDHSIDQRFGDTVIVGVVGGSNRALEIKTVLEGYADKKLKGKPLEIITLGADELENREVDLVFFSEPLGGNAKKYAEICRRKNATGVSFDEAGVVAGIPLGVELTDDGKPKLLINLNAAKAAGANFSAQVLKLARLVEGK